MTIGETSDALKARMLDRVLTIGEVAKLLGVCVTTVRRYVADGKLQCFRTPGNQRRFFSSEARRFLQELEMPVNAG